MRARGKVALVTGGSRRIGATISRAPAKAGYEVVLTYRTSAVEGKGLAARRGIRTPEGVARAVLHFARAANYNRRTDPHHGGVP